ncbi:hypothetical protein EU546_07495 [Candidatus Thorarchaeota archaeon]|nr:MAG: hypothetical protein EU546_07495 [Candidatus Thorarchaeota archaeon]
MLFEDIMSVDWAIWTLLLTFGIIGVSIGPGVLIYVYAKSVQAKYAVTYESQQTLSLPQYCPKCNNEVRVNQLEWIGEEEARCPYCSSEIPVRRTLF